jgi:G3E family GTPase
MIDNRLPVTVLTGFLGSGKTTLLRRLLTAERMARTAVVVNEFGEIGIDHLLVRDVAEAAVVMKNGCICCSIRTDVQTSLRDLIDGRSSGKVPPFDRIVLETTGLADPVPIAQTLVADPMLRHQTQLANIVTTVDGIYGADQIRIHPECLIQAAVADRLVITKIDLPEARDIEGLRARLGGLNPTARVLDAAHVAAKADLVFDHPVDAAGRREEVRGWFSCAPAGLPRPTVGQGHQLGDVSSCVFRSDEPVDWTAFGVWLSALLHCHGPRIMRVKGLLNVGDPRGPVVLNSVRTVVHRPEHLDRWPDEDRSTRIVFIVHRLDAGRILRSLTRYLGATGMYGGEGEISRPADVFKKELRR